MSICICDSDKRGDIFTMFIGCYATVTAEDFDRPADRKFHETIRKYSRTRERSLTRDTIYVKLSNHNPNELGITRPANSNFASVNLPIKFCVYKQR